MEYLFNGRYWINKCKKMISKYDDNTFKIIIIKNWFDKFILEDNLVK